MRIVENQGIDVVDDFRKLYAAEYRTKDGHYVRSKAELTIDDSLYLWGIPHAYEKKLPNTEENVYSDFHIPSGKGRPKAVYIEYWGMENDEKYNQRKNKKIEIYNSLKPRNTVNMGYGWDRTENVLWRIYHDELDGFEAKQIFMMIGTNNFGRDSINEIVKNIQFLFSAIHLRQPKAQLFTIGILPRKGLEKKVVDINRLLAKAAATMHARFIDPGKVLLNKKSEIDESLFNDGLHPSAEGYRRLATELKKVVK